jgi:hypothetical protein
MWQFAFMLQFTDIPFSSESALRSIALLSHSLTNVLVAYGRSCDAPWVEFLPAPITPSSDDMENGREALAEACASKDNVLLIALGKFKEAARNKARLFSFFQSRVLSPLPSIAFVSHFIHVQARIERLKAAQLARKAGSGISPVCGGSGEALAASSGDHAGVVEGTGTYMEGPVAQHFSSSPAAPQDDFVAPLPNIASRIDMPVERDEGEQLHSDNAATPLNMN